MSWWDRWRESPRGGNRSAHFRRLYADPAGAFGFWVRSLGFHRTRMGQWILKFDQRFQVRRLFGFAVFSLLLSTWIFTRFDLVPLPRVGTVSTGVIKSPITIDLVDELATEELRREAEGQILTVLDYDPRAYDRLFDRIYNAFSKLRKLARGVQWPESAAGEEEAVKEFLVHRELFEQELGRSVGVREFEWLVKKRFAVRIENAINQILSRLEEEKIVEDLKRHLLPGAQSVMVRIIKDGQPTRETLVSVSQLRDLADLQTEDWMVGRSLEGLGEEDQRELKALTRQLMIPNLTSNFQETEARRNKARGGILPVHKRIEKGQVIVAEGQMVQSGHLDTLSQIRALRSARSLEVKVVAAAILFMASILVLLSFFRRVSPQRASVSNRDFLCLAVISLISVSIVKGFGLLSEVEALDRYAALGLTSLAPLFLAPLALAPMLAGLVLTSVELASLFAIFSAITISVVSEFQVGVVAISLLGGIAATRGVQGCQKRNQIYFAGLRVGLIQALAVMAVTVISRVGEADLIVATEWNLAAGFASGLLSSLFAVALVPLFESAFNYTTNLRLLELASLNHPLMKDMIVRAPGTYHHSLVVGSMCEAAAEKIGANPLLAKVMAYYHDIGKTPHAQYFIENQRPGHNPHDHISPHMSKTVLVAHVKDGAEMGLRARLGKPIVDGILQHHGTTLISYFYHRAKEEQSEDGPPISEDDFRYPGPKPQFREAALVMLADSIEAAARSLDEPNSARLQSIVKNIIQSKFLDGQLEECNLTLRDLTIIERTFKKILLGVYHHRIDYPMRPASEEKSRLKVESRSRRGVS